MHAVACVAYVLHLVSWRLLSAAADQQDHAAVCAGECPHGDGSGDDG